MKDEQEIVNIRSAEIASYKKLDEIRIDAGLEPIGEEGGGNMILNPTLIQYQLQQQANQMQQQAGQEQEQQPQQDAQNAPADLSQTITHARGFTPQK
jgi:hypothetical protein